jgi:hypothetical protein
MSWQRYWNKPAADSISTGMEELDPTKVRLHIGAALRTRLIRDVIVAAEDMRRSIAMIDTLPPPAIEVLRDQVSASWAKREGPLGDFARAFITYLDAGPLVTARQMERRLEHGITGVGEDEVGAG